MIRDSVTAEKMGYLRGEFRLFHLKDTGGIDCPLHYHDFLKIMLLIEGRVTYTVEGRSYALSPGDLVLIDQGQLHRPQADPSLPYERFLLYLSPSFLSEYGTEEAPLDGCFARAAYRHSGVLRPSREEGSSLAALLLRLEKAQERRNEDYAGPLYARLLCLEFLVNLNRLSLSPSASYLPTGLLDYRVSGLISYINGHLNEDLSVARLSKLCSLSPYHMMRLFKQETGCTAAAYICEKRLIHARELLAAGTSATEACYQSGFGSYASFFRAYKSHYHENPKSFAR